MENNLKKRKRMHLKDFTYKGSHHVFFLTICTAHKHNFFSDKRIAEIIIDTLEFKRNEKEIKLFCYCLMPDHLHILFSFTNSYQNSLQNWVSTFKRYTTKTIKKSFGLNCLWHKNFYDHIVRKEESLIKIAEYIVNNPVRKGLVENWQDYPFSRIVDRFPL